MAKPGLTRVPSPCRAGWSGLRILIPLPFPSPLFLWLKNRFSRPQPAGAYLPPRCSEEAAVLEVLFDDDIRDGVKDEFDVLRVCGTGHVAVDLLHVLSHVEVKELGLDVISGVFKGVGTWGGRRRCCC